MCEKKTLVAAKTVLEEGAPGDGARVRKLPAAARRALAEADERRKREADGARRLAPEVGGRREGLEPTRYGDWEKKGIVSDF